MLIRLITINDLEYKLPCWTKYRFAMSKFDFPKSFILINMINQINNPLNYYYNTIEIFKCKIVIELNISSPKEEQ